MNKKTTIIAVTIKLMISVFITYLILFKGDAGFLIHNIGAFLVGGNYIIGLSSLVNITLLYVVFLNNLLINHQSLIKLKTTLLFSDITLIIINLVLGIYISNTYYQMPMADVQSKFVILAAGSAVVYFIMSIIVALIVLKTQNNIEIDSNSSQNINNNPFSFKGRIERLPYLITKISLLIIFVMTGLIIKFCNKPEYFVLLAAIFQSVFFAIGLFAANKRLRDIKWNQLFLLVWAIPYIGLLIGIPLLCVKTKQ